MLKGINPLLNADVLYVLRAMGHGDDLIVADNFLRACSKKKIKQIIYLGGILPKDEKVLSDHLDSRLEIENYFKTSGILLTTFRAGMIMGTGGSSFNIMLNLLKRLPVLGLPEWTKTKSQPVHVDYVAQCSPFDKQCPTSMNLPKQVSKEIQELSKDNDNDNDNKVPDTPTNYFCNYQKSYQENNHS